MSAFQQMTNVKAPSRRRRDKFYPEEDERLRTLVNEFGEGCWDKIALRIPGRNARQVRERWKHYLSGSKALSQWTDAEDAVLIEKVHSIGPKWTKIAAFFQGRTDLQVKARWAKLLRIQRSYFPQNAFPPPNPPVSEPIKCTSIQSEQIESSPNAESAQFQAILEELGVQSKDNQEMPGSGANLDDEF